ncbi:ABC transporter ATP-binding protein, partial [Bacillus thuringiensis]|uniref:ABC transporter ATP-binding protein n=3 Tax=Bacillus TaxID=1386 RepID=UPI002100123B
FYYDWELTLIIIIAIPVFLLFFIPLGKILSKFSKSIQKSTAKLNVSAVEMISEIKLIKSFTAENYQIVKGMEDIKDLKNIGIRQSKWIVMVNPILNLIMMIIIVTIIGYGGVKLANGDLTSGTFIAFLTLIFYLMGPIANFGLFFTQLQKTKGATERISQLLSEEEESQDKGKVLSLTDKDLEIKDISFRYSNQENVSFSLQNINLTIQGGSTYALVGPSGSGKTTLISLLERFYKPSSGKICIGGEDIENFSLMSWRSQIGYVSQEHSLISGNVRENLIFGLAEQPSEDKLIEACKMACAWGFIEKLPNGLDTYIGEKGGGLSGGQRQRIAIARMFLKNPEIILLDEATANLDSQSEEIVHSAMKEITKGRTAIIIAHRLSTIIDAENIIFMEDGRITGQGKHGELQKTHKLYKQFCEQQFQTQTSKQQLQLQ